MRTPSRSARSHRTTTTTRVLAVVRTLIVLLALALVVHFDALGWFISEAQIVLAQSQLRPRLSNSHWPPDDDATTTAAHPSGCNDISGVAMISPPLARRAEWWTAASLKALCDASPRRRTTEKDDDHVRRVAVLLRNDGLDAWTWQFVLGGAVDAMSVRVGCVLFSRVVANAGSLAADLESARHFDGVLASDLVQLNKLQQGPSSHRRQQAPLWRGFVGFAPGTGQDCVEDASAADNAPTSSSAADSEVLWHWAFLAQPSCAALRRLDRNGHRVGWLPLGGRHATALLAAAAAEPSSTTPAAVNAASRSRPAWLGFSGVVTADRPHRLAAVLAARKVCAQMKVSNVVVGSTLVSTATARCGPIGVSGLFALAEASRAVAKYVPFISPLVRVLDTWSARAHHRSLQDSRFTLCPSGHSPETYRLWEAFTLGSIPIVQRTCLARRSNTQPTQPQPLLPRCTCPPFVQFLLDAGAPMIVLDDWATELEGKLAPYVGHPARVEALQRKCTEWFAGLGAHLRNAIAAKVVESSMQ